MPKPTIIMKSISIIISLFILAGGWVQAQTMRWIPWQPGLVTGDCAQGIPAPKDARTCYVLEYTPAVSGVLTSYTTGFFIDCGSMGPTIDRNLSCSMHSSVVLRNACETLGFYQIGASGQGGTTGNAVKANEPIYLHLVCFELPEGGSLVIREDEFTDLTTSIDASGGQYVTEYPIFERTVLSRPRTDDAQLTPWLGFSGEAAGHLRSRLTWDITAADQSPVRFILERAVNGRAFEPIAEIPVGNANMDDYSYIDEAASVGINNYRLQLVYGSGAITTSPVRRIEFADEPFSWVVTPNPASTMCEVRWAGLAGEGDLQLLAADGRLVHSHRAAPGAATWRLDVSNLPAGSYSIVFLSGGQQLRQPLIVTR